MTSTYKNKIKTGLVDKHGTEIKVGDRTRLILDSGEVREFDVCLKTVKRTVRSHPDFDNEFATVNITGVVFCWQGYELFPCVGEDGIPDNEKMKIISRQDSKGIMTNADRIRSMTDEELADFIDRAEMTDIVYSITFCDMCEIHMDRLLTKYDGQNVPVKLCTIDIEGEADDCLGCNDQCEECNSDCASCAIQEAFDQLAKYEDTGLTPEQIAEIDKLYAEKCKELAECQNKWVPVTWHERTADDDYVGAGYDKVLDCPLPEDDTEILVCDKSGQNIWSDTFFNDGDGCYLDGGYDVVEEIAAWQPLPEPYRKPQK